MATAKYDTRTVTKTVEVEEKVVDLRLSLREAADLHLYVRHIGGSPERSARRSAGQIARALAALRVEPTKSPVIKSMEFPDDFQIEAGIYSALED
jgi:hypothetical protein